jgi:hypothetical protein
MLLQVLKQLAMVPHHPLNHQVMLVNKEEVVVVFQVLNQVKGAPVVVVVVLHHLMNQVHFQHTVVLHSVLPVHLVIRATTLLVVVVVILI